MVPDTYALSPLMIGLVANALGYAAPLLFFLPLRRLIAAPYLDAWLAAYACLAVAAVLSFPHWLDHDGLTMTLAAFAAAGCAMLLRIPDLLAGRAPPDRGLAVAGAVLVAACGVLAWRLPDATPLVHTAPILMALILTKLHVGLAFYRHRERFLGNVGSWLMGLFLLDGLWLLSLYPAHRLDHVWLSLLIAGLLHLGLAIGVAMSLVVSAPTLLREHEAAPTRMERFATDIVATVSHELRTPLTVLKMSAWMLEESLRDDGLETRRALAADMVAATDRLAHFLDRLLDLAQHEHGQVTYEMEQGCLGALIKEVVADVEPLFDEAGVGLTVQAAGAVPACFDPERMRQVVTNLLGNALKFTPRGGQVTCEVRTVAGAGQLTVRDEGPGVPFAEQALIFTRFYRGAHGQKGLGLGLAISKAIVEDGHGGRLWVESPSPGGACFHVSLPRVAVAPEVRP